MTDTKPTSKTIENVVIIGGGPAGLSAAIYNSRASLNPVLFAGSPPGGQLTLTTEVENYPGYKSIMGPELIEMMRGQAQSFGTRILNQNVKEVDFSVDPFVIRPAGKDAEAIYARTVIIATGAKALWLGLDSETRLRGRGVSACATCDGFFFRDKVVAVIGGGDTAMEDSLTLTKFAKKVYVIHRRGEFRASKIMQQRVLEHEKIEVIWDTQVTDVIGEQNVQKLSLQNLKTNEASELEVNGMFVAIGHKPDTDIFKDHIALDDHGYILTSEMVALRSLESGKSVAEPWKSKGLHFPTMTSVPGVFAAGDCVDFIYRQASTSVGKGVAASLDAERFLAKM
jgi:thioredoxin reductase (NADPH)